MVMLTEQYDYVIGGDPERDTIDLAVVDTSTWRVRAHLADNADGPGYAHMLAWAAAHAPGPRVWALEGTGSFAAGLAAFLAEAGEDVVEVAADKRVPGAKSEHRRRSGRPPRDGERASGDATPARAARGAAYGAPHPTLGAEHQPHQGDQ